MENAVADIVVRPMAVGGALQPDLLLKNLQTAMTQAPETADFCIQLCEGMVTTVCTSAHTLTLLSVGSLSPDDKQALNKALPNCLWPHYAALRAYVLHGWDGQLWLADDSRDRGPGTSMQI